jgi:monofunctional biosynthetic peptidoglycan transglycosylase
MRDPRRFSRPSMTDDSETDPGYEPARLWRMAARRRRVGMAIGAAALLLVALTTLLAYITSDSVRDRLRARVERTLQERVGTVQVGDRFGIDWLGRVSFGPIAIVTPNGADPVVRIELVEVSPRYRSLLAGRTEVSEVILSGVRVDTGVQGKSLQQLVAQIQGKRAERPEPKPGAAPRPSPPLPEIRFENVAIVGRRTPSDDEVPVEINLLEGRILYERGSAGKTLSAEAALPGGGRATAEARWSEAGPAKIHLRTEAVQADALPRALRALLPAAIAQGVFTADIRAEAESGGITGNAVLAVDVQDLILKGERLAPDPVGPMRLTGGGNLRWNWEAKRVSLESMRIALGDKGQARVTVTIQAVLGDDPTFAAGARIEHIDYQAALDALPPAFTPGQGTPRLEGLMSAWFQVMGPMRRPANWEVTAEMDITGLRETARQEGALFLSGPFYYKPMDKDGNVREIIVGPDNANFVPISELPTFLTRGVVASEDGGFFKHRGFDFQEIKNSFIAVSEAGRAVRGGSTISQQLAKNLFLSREKTYARKVKEALVTIAIEAVISKERMLEIYLNVIEWGPGLYGIGEAAYHYFGKKAKDLTPKEAAFLITIIPNPNKYYVYFTRGALTDAWETRVRELLFKMKDAGALSDSQLMEALRTPVKFARG